MQPYPTALMLSLCRHFRENYNIAAITNDIFTREDGEFLVRHEALEAGRIRAVETGGRAGAHSFPHCVHIVYLHSDWLHSFDFILYQARHCV